MERSERMMESSERNEIEDLLRESALTGYELPRGREALRGVLAAIGRAPMRNTTAIVIWRVVAALSGSFFVAAAFVLMIIDRNDRPGPTNSLGGVWSTFTDSAQGGTSAVWPPVSDGCTNRFEKSSPGYGDRGYAVRITGETGDGRNAHLGINTYLSERAICPRCMGIDLRSYRGIRFRIKGWHGKGKLRFVLPHQSMSPAPDRRSCMSLTGGHDYSADITENVTREWAPAKLEFRKHLSQPVETPDSLRVSIETVLENVNLLQWRWEGEPHQSIDLWIDDVELF